MKSPMKSSNLAQIFSNRNYRLSFILLLICLLWLMSGLLGSEEKDDANEPVTKADKTLVQARYIQSQPFQPLIQVRARTEPSRQVSLKAEVSGRVVGLPIVEGQLVAEGDIICELAVDDRQLRLQEAESAVAQAQLEYDGSLRLKTGGYQSKTAIAAAKARLDTAKADLKGNQLRLAQTMIRAPFAGVVDSHSVDVGDYVNVGDECGVIMDLDPLVVSGRVSEREVGRLSVGDVAQAYLLTGESVDAVLSLVGFAPDDVTRSFLVEAKVPNSELALRSGITTRLNIPTQMVSAHVLAPSLLSLDDDGRVGVRTLSDSHQVQFIHVNLLGDHQEGVWVSGLPERTLLVTVGQEYISEGELVDVKVENPIQQPASPPVLVAPSPEEANENQGEVESSRYSAELSAVES